MPTGFAYLDAAATTPVEPGVVAVMLRYLYADGLYANPSATAHDFGLAAEAAINQARRDIADALRCEPREIIFTSGATEANNLALQGIAHAHAAKGRHLIVSAIEHKSVLATADALARQGFNVSHLPPQPNGCVNPEDLAALLRPDTLLVSLQHINNETGAVQPIEACAERLAAAGVLFHVDAAQSAGKFDLDLSQTPIDLLSLSAHKIHGPKGIGALIVKNRPRLRLQPILYGGGQEYGLRPGTLPTHQIMGFAAALRIACARRQTDHAHASRLRRLFLETLQTIGGFALHGGPDRQSPYIVNFSIAGLDADALINHLRPDIALASGAACASGAIEPSHVLRAMGLSGERLYGAVRASFHRHTTEAEVSHAAAKIRAVAAAFNAETPPP
ncbi:MAG: cysteine desulfurase family protein [Candidatus Methylumidiphilus sp.]